MWVGLFVAALGLVPIGAALLADDDGFMAPRWIVALVGGMFLAAGLSVLRRAQIAARAAARDSLLNACGALICTGFAVLSLFFLCVEGPGTGEMSIDLPLWLLPSSVPGLVTRGLFYLVVGSAAVLSSAATIAAWWHTLRGLGPASLLAVAGLIAGPAAWVFHLRSAEAARPRHPLVHLSFDAAVTDGAPMPGVAVHGDELTLVPGVQGQALWIGGTEDWIDYELPAVADVSGSLTLELWMRRDDWLNPYRAGGAQQMPVSVELMNRRGWLDKADSVSYLAFGLRLLLPRELARFGADELRPAHFYFWPYADVGNTRLGTRGPSLPAQQWTHVALVYDRLWFQQARLYLDGELVARGTPKGSAPRFDHLRTLRVGTRYQANGAFRGAVDEVKLYGCALSEEEIRAAARQGKQP